MGKDLHQAKGRHPHGKAIVNTISALEMGFLHKVCMLATFGSWYFRVQQIYFLLGEDSSVDKTQGPMFKIPATM